VSISHLEAQAKPVEDLSGPPPIIEVYKRPRVEVYRRRSSGHFERD
jgi:branched-chain amino acid transport system ATP-binding protein